MFDDMSVNPLSIFGDIGEYNKVICITCLRENVKKCRTDNASEI